MKKGYKLCPFCKNEIKEEAIKCQHCLRFLEGEENKENLSTSIKGGKNNSIPWILCTIFGIIIVILLLIIFLKQPKISNNNLIKDSDNTPLLLNDTNENLEITINNEEEIVTENDIAKKPIKEGWIKYDNGGLSFYHPSNLNVSNERFSVFEFLNGININVYKYDYETYLRMVSEDYGIMPFAEERTDQQFEDYYKERSPHYKAILDSIKNGNRNGETICTYGCDVARGVIGTKPIELNGVNGLINNYYFTQDPDLVCLSEVNTELLLVKNNAIYTIMFKYNFGDVYDFLKLYKEDNSEICLNYGKKINRDALTINERIENFFSYKTDYIWGEGSSFKTNYDIILEMIDTVELK